MFRWPWSQEFWLGLAGFASAPCIGMQSLHYTKRIWSGIPDQPCHFERNKMLETTNDVKQYAKKKILGKYGTRSWIKISQLWGMLITDFWWLTLNSEVSNNPIFQYLRYLYPALQLFLIPPCGTGPPTTNHRLDWITGLLGSFPFSWNPNSVGQGYD